jgi:hypothetical protein
MRHTSKMRIRALAAIALGLSIAAPLAGAEASTPPSLRITSNAPLTLRGSGFRALEVVQLTITNGDRTWRRATHAGSAGGFVSRWSSVTLNYCTLPLAISARGAKTGTVHAKIPVRDCAAP